VLGVWARRECEAEGLAVEFEGGEGACGGGIAGCGGDGGEGCVAGRDYDVELLRGEEVVEAVGAAGGLEVLACGVDFFAFGGGLEGGEEVVLVGACWGELVLRGSRR
jgi:hypothetical protein